MNVQTFIETAIKIANEPTIYYSVAGGDWCKWNGSSWNMDCVCMIKGILWGFNFDKTAAHGGAIYGSNGVYDDGADSLINRCTDISNDFSAISTGEIVYMDGHVGVYIGNGQVVESTAWFNKTIISDIDWRGSRKYKGYNGGKWEKHGYLPYIDYINKETKNTINSDIDNYSDEELAKMVWNGDFGNGKERKEKLGTRYESVQRLVNQGVGKNATTGIYYVVKTGDTLSEIAEKYNMNWSTLYLQNKEVIGEDPNLIHPGDRLFIK